MRHFDSIIQEVQDNMQDMPSQELRSKILANAEAGVASSAVRQRFNAYPMLLAAIVAVLVFGSAYTAYAVGAFDNLRRYERHASHLDNEIPEAVYRGEVVAFCEETFVDIGHGFWVNEEGDTIYCEETFIYIGDGIFFDLKLREFQLGLQDYGWERITAGEIHEGRVPEELWCLCGGPVYMRPEASTIINDTTTWGREGWFRSMQTRGYVSDDGTEYIEMERLSSVSFICPACDSHDTARYGIMYREYEWMPIASLGDPHISIDRLNVVEYK